jgi:hypothetical protein
MEKKTNQKHVKNTYIMSLNIVKNINKLHYDMDFGPKLVHCNLHWPKIWSNDTLHCKMLRHWRIMTLTTPLINALLVAQI